MRQLKRKLELLERLDQLIRLKGTGRPSQLARRLDVSESTLFRTIEVMKELKAPVYYDWGRQSYAYKEPTIFKFGFFLESLDGPSEKDISAGYGFRNINELLKL